MISWKLNLLSGRHVRTCMVLAVTLLVSACGGGGGGGGGGSSAPTAGSGTPGVQMPSISTASSIVNSAPTSTFAIGSAERLAYEYLNAERLRDGFGAVAESLPVYNAAKGHADYQLRNNTGGHVQYTELFYSNAPTTPVPTVGFTGATPSDRLIAAGYGAAGTFGGAYDEIHTQFDSSQNKVLYGGAVGIRSLLNAPLHMSGLLSGSRDIGIAVRSESDVNVSFPPYAPRIVTQINLAHKNSVGEQIPASNEVLVYPCNGATNVGRALYGEKPNPVPGRDLSTNPLGRSMLIYVRPQNSLAITTYSMVVTATNTPVVLRAPATPLFGGSYQQYIAADSPNAANTQYTFNVAGTNNGTAFSKICKFTTGN